MRIVHVSNFTTKWNGESFYTIPYKLNNGLARLGHYVFPYCDRDVADGFFFGVRDLGKAHANGKLRLVCEQIRPDLLLLGHCTIIRPETVAAIRERFPNVRIVHWNCDPLFERQNMARLKALAPLVDATLITTAGPYLEEVARSGPTAFMPNPVDNSIETLRMFEKTDGDIDLVFMGGANKARAASCALIRERIPGLNFQTYGFGGAPSCFGAKTFDVVGRAKMGLSLSKRSDVHLYSSDRMAFYMGCGLLTLVDRRTGFGTLFDDDELAFYEGDDDLVDKIRYFKANDARRQEVARRGWQKAHERFNETLVAQWIVDAAFGGKPSQNYAWPTAISGGR